MTVRLKLGAAIAVGALLAALLPGSALAADWPTYHGDNTRTGVDATEGSVTGISQAWQGNLDGKVYGSPVTVDSQVIVATENNSVYSFNQVSGAQNWHHQVTAPYLGGLPCGNLGPPMGITGTPVVDPITGYVYVVALVAGPDYVLYALNVNSGGSEVFHTGVNPGTNFNASYQGQRPALALANGYVYISYGGRDGDCGTYHGWVVAAHANGSPGISSWHTSLNDASHPGANEGGLWGASGPAVDASGNLIIATGNGVCASTTYDDTNSVIKLSATLSELDFWAPSDWHSLSCSDTDIGSLGPMILPNGNIFQSGKASVSYLINSSGMGGIAGSNDGNAFQMSNCNGAFGGAAAYAGLVFVPCPFTPSIVALNTSGGQLSEAWHETIAGGMPIVAGGFVWAIGGGALHGFGYQDGAATYSLPVESHTNSFPTLAAANGKIFYAGDAHLTAFQLAATSTGGAATTYSSYNLGFQQPDRASTWYEVDPALRTTFTVASGQAAIVGGNMDLWTTNPGYNQDLGIFKTDCSLGNLLGWKESGGSAGTYSPNAAFIQTVITTPGTFTLTLCWKSNKPGPAGTVYGAAGTADTYFSPTSLTIKLVPAANVVSAVKTSSYVLSSQQPDPASTWYEVDPALRVQITAPAGGSLVLGGNMDLWTSALGYNQDLAIFSGTNCGDLSKLVSWKESGGYAGTLSPDAAFVEGVVPVSSGQVSNFTLCWKVNRVAPPNTIFGAAGTSDTYFSPTRLTAEFVLAPNFGSASQSASYHLDVQQPDRASTWYEVDSRLRVTVNASAGQDVLLGGNMDLWTVAAGYNQDLAIFVGTDCANHSNLLAWKESGGFAGTRSPNAAFVQTRYPVASGGSITFTLCWKANRVAPGATVYGAAGTGDTYFSPTRLTAEVS